MSKIGKNKKSVKVVLNDKSIPPDCIQVGLYLLCMKNKRKVKPCNIRTSIPGSTYILEPGKEYEIVLNFSDNTVQSGLFNVERGQIRTDKERPPPIVPQKL